MRGCGRISALVVGLQGRFAEAETIVKADLPPDEAAANVAYLKQMLNRKDNPRAGAATIAGGVAQPSRLIGRIDPRSSSASRTLKRGDQSIARSRGCTALCDRRAHCIAATLMPVGPRMTTNSTGRKNRIIGTVSFGGSAAAFFSASFMRMSRFSCAITRRLWPSGVP